MADFQPDQYRVTYELDVPNDAEVVVQEDDAGARRRTVRVDPYSLHVIVTHYRDDVPDVRAYIEGQPIRSDGVRARRGQGTLGWTSESPTEPLTAAPAWVQERVDWVIEREGVAL